MLLLPSAECITVKNSQEEAFNTVSQARVRAAQSAKRGETTVYHRWPCTIPSVQETRTLTERL